ncbi:MAG: hypothetical protein ABSD20_01205 [Terriglobales bacterium]|jgi:hypothetical protein
MARKVEVLSSLIAAAGLIWSAQVMTANFSKVKLLMPPPVGPLEVCAGGVILWLLAKWRRSVQVR